MGGKITLQSDVSEADRFDFEYKRYSKTGSADRCVVNMDPESRREVGGRNKDLELSLIFGFDNKFLCKIPMQN